MFSEQFEGTGHTGVFFRVLFLKLTGSPSAAFLSTATYYNVCTWAFGSHYLPLISDLSNTH